MVTHMSRHQSSPFVGCQQADNRLEVTVRDDNGIPHIFAITAEEVGTPATSKPANEGCNTECSTEGAKAAAAETVASGGGCGKKTCNDNKAAPAAG